MNKVGDRICVNPLPGLDINGNEYDIIGSGGTITKIDGNEFIVEMFDGPILRVEAGDYDEVSQIKAEF